MNVQRSKHICVETRQELNADKELRDSVRGRYFPESHGGLCHDGKIHRRVEIKFFGESMRSKHAHKPIKHGENQYYNDVLTNYPNRHSLSCWIPIIFYPINNTMKRVAVALVCALLVVIFALVFKFTRAIPVSTCKTVGAEACQGTDIVMREITGANPCLVLFAKIGQYETVFCIDTGFAGPCLLSLPCMVMESKSKVTEDLQSWCDRTQIALTKSTTSSTEHETSLQRFLEANRCSDFTSGCTMRLSSIGMTKEQTSEMLLTPPLELVSTDGKWTSPRACSGQPVAEVITSTPMATLHLLTCDWLSQNSPALILPAEGILRTNMSAADFTKERISLKSISTELSGGAFVAAVRVNGVQMRVTVDSGAACYLSIGAQAAKRMKDVQFLGKTMRQIGANGEHICSRAANARVVFAQHESVDVPVLINDMNLDGEDGYMGICHLRHFDLCITPNEMFARRNDLTFDATLLDGVLSAKKC